MIVLQLLAVFGLCFGLQQKFGPWALVRLGVPPEVLQEGLADWLATRAALVAEFDARGGPPYEGQADLAWWRRFLVKLIACPYCSGFHAGWIGWLMFTYAPPVLTWGLAGAAACYLLDNVALVLEAWKRGPGT